MDHANEEEAVTLHDGSQVLMRAVHRDDLQMLIEGLTKLGPESRRLRFLTAKTHFSSTELRYLTELDHRNHDAIGARDADGHGLGIARFIRDPEHPEVAEIAVAVVDDWQGRGLGSALLSRIYARARQEGIERILALVDEGNEAMTALLQSLGGEIRIVAHDHGAISYEITLLREVPEADQPLRRPAPPPGNAP